MVSRYYQLFENEELLKTVIELTGNGEVKPFECVGTYDEVNYALINVINKTENLPFLLKYYKYNFEMKNDSINFEKRWNNENNLDFEFVNLLKGELDKYVK